MATHRKIPPGGTRGTVFREVAKIRLADAEVLLLHHRYPGAVYLAGYAVECLLKWAVTRYRNAIHLPATLEIHDWGTLLAAAGLGATLRKDKTATAIFWAVADVWGPELRYLSRQPPKRDAETLYRRMVFIYDWISDNVL